MLVNLFYLYSRHLVLNKDIEEKDKKPKTDKIRYQYDEHYFLTDPDEFIQEFWARDLDWQLLEKPISREEFEALPFVRSVFFHYGLELSEPMKAVLYTDKKGGVDVRLLVPEDLADDLVFHYQLRFADRERRNDVEYKVSPSYINAICYCLEKVCNARRRGRYVFTVRYSYLFFSEKKFWNSRLWVFQTLLFQKLMILSRNTQNLVLNIIPSPHFEIITFWSFENFNLGDAGMF